MVNYYTAKDLARWSLTASQVESIIDEAEKLDAFQQDIFITSFINKKQSPRFALMCAYQQAPGTRFSDKTFNSEMRKAMMERKSPQMDEYLKIAKKSGINTQGKFYVSGFGRPSDPMAWVSTVDEAKDVCKRKNLTTLNDGLIQHKGHEEEYKRVRMAPDIREDLVRRKLAQDSSLAAKCKADPAKLNRVRAEVVDRHASSGT